jgi:hypothetical protein
MPNNCQVWLRGGLAARAIIHPMPRPMSERQALERERDELPVQLANYQGEFDGPLWTPSSVGSGWSGGFGGAETTDGG